MFARAEANTLLPGRVPADEEESRLRLTLMFLDRQNVTDDNAAALAAQAAATRTLRRGQCLGYQVYLQAACHSFRALYPTPDNPFPPRTDNHAQQDSQMLENCALNAVRWMGDCFNCLRGQGRAANGVQWQLGGVHALSCGNVLCKTVCDFLRMTQMNNHSDSFRHAVDELWHSPQLANRRLAWAEMAPSHSKLIDKHAALCRRRRAPRPGHVRALWLRCQGELPQGVQDVRSLPLGRLLHPRLPAGRLAKPQARVQAPRSRARRRCQRMSLMLNAARKHACCGDANSDLNMPSAAAADAALSSTQKRKKRALPTRCLPLRRTRSV